MSKKVVKIEDVLRIQKERSAINRLKFDDIMWTKNGKEVHISPNIKERWQFCGLNNMDFITSGTYRQKLNQLTKPDSILVQHYGVNMVKRRRS